MNGLFVLLPALFVSPSAFANPSIYAACAGGGWSIEIGVQPGPGTTDLVELTVDDGKNHISAYEASVPARMMKRSLWAGLVFRNKNKTDEQATFKLKRTAGTWTYDNADHGLSCEIN